MGFEALSEYVIVKPDDVADVTEAGIKLTRVDPAKVGTVVSVGPKVEELSKGDRVRFQNVGGVDIEVDDQNYLVFHIDEIAVRLTD